jgi:hypothetical protein
MYAKSGRIGLFFLAAVLIAAVFWLWADRDIAAVNSPYDDAWFLQKGRCAYWFDCGAAYSPINSFLKEPPYPLFIAGSRALGIPLYLAHLALYAAAAGALSLSLVYRQTAGIVGLIVFAALMLQPLPGFVFERAIHDSIYTSLLLLAVAALLWQFKGWRQRGQWRRWLASGVALGLLWNTRQERPLVLILVLVFVAAGLIAARRPASWEMVRGFLGECLAPMGVAGCLTLLLMAANYWRWGVFALTDVSAPGFQSAYRELLRIRPERPLPYVSVTREARQRAYEVSPAFRELEPFLEKEVETNRPHAWSAAQDIPPGEYSGGWFVLRLRGAAAAAGHCGTARQAEDFYGRIATELKAAAAQGRLATRWLLPIGGWSLHPDVGVYVHRLWPSWREVWHMCWSYRGDRFPNTDDPELDADTRRLFDEVAGRRRTITAEARSTRATARGWLWVIRENLAEVLLASAFFVSGVVVWWGREPAEWGLYLLPAVALGSYGFARLAVFALFDASVFPGTDIRYLLPSAISLTAVAVWLWAEGVRLLARAWAHGRDIAVAGRRPWVLRAVTAGVLFLMSGLLAAQWAYGKWRPPDATTAVGSIDQINSEYISGWARLKERPDETVNVEIYVDDRLVETAVAEDYRADLHELRIGTGRHGFTIPTPPALKDGQRHIVVGRIVGTNYTLAGSPFSVKLPLSEAPP